MTLEKTGPPAFRHDFPFDPTYGYDLDALLKVPAPPEPDGFVEFWRARYEAARNVTLNVEMHPSRTAGNSKVAVYDVSFTSLGEYRIGGWITLPRHEPITRGLVVGHGYGGRDQPDLGVPVPGAAVIFPCLRGQSRSQSREIPPLAAGHVRHGIESRETYVHGGCAADIWCAASALTALVPEAARRLDYLGGSFGGGIGALALPWDDRFTKAHLAVPSFGNYPLRLSVPCTGSGASVSEYAAEHPGVIDVLRWFDAATAARHIHIPIHVAAALFDPAVPPPGQFAVYNAIPGPKELFVLRGGHFEWPEKPEEDRRLHQALARFFHEGPEITSGITRS